MNDSANPDANMDGKANLMALDEHAPANILRIVEVPVILIAPVYTLISPKFRKLRLGPSGTEDTLVQQFQICVRLVAK